MYQPEPQRIATMRLRNGTALLQSSPRRLGIYQQKNAPVCMEPGPAHANRNHCVSMVLHETQKRHSRAQSEKTYILGGCSGTYQLFKILHVLEGSDAARRVSRD